MFDEFFYFLQRFQILDPFFALDPNISKRHTNVQFPTVILIYLMRVVAILAKHGFFPKRIMRLRLLACPASHCFYFLYIRA